MDIDMADVTVHIDETLDDERRALVADGVRGAEGVVSVGYDQGRPHLMIVEYNPAQTDSQQVLASVTSQGVHAELIGL
ncbi:MAG: ATP-binding protein [Chromatiales bacterium]|jgi:hypothetical protein